MDSWCLMLEITYDAGIMPLVSRTGGISLFYILINNRKIPSGAEN